MKTISVGSCKMTTVIPQAPTLKDCPFCGGVPELEFELDEIEAYVKCQTCGAKTDHIRAGMEYCANVVAAQQWNMRVVPKELL